MTQGTDLVPFLTALESVELTLSMRGVSRNEASARATATLASVGLGELSGQRVARLSMGERQRVAVARALAARPQLLLADEPTARLDEANARAVGRLFAEFAATTGTAIVCATHDPVLIEHARVEVPLGTLAAVSQARGRPFLRGYRAFVAGDLDAIEGMLDPEVEWIGVGEVAAIAQRDDVLDDPSRPPRGGLPGDRRPLHRRRRRVVVSMRFSRVETDPTDERPLQSRRSISSAATPRS